MTNEVMNDFLSLEDVARYLDVSVNTARDMMKQCEDIKEVDINGGSKKKLYSIKEVNEIRDSKQQQQQLETLAKRSEKLADKNDIKTLGTAFANKLDEIPDDCDDETFDQMYNASMFLVGKMLARSERRLKISEERRLNTEREKQEIEKDRNELLCFKQEVNNIYIKKYKSKELRSKINKEIRKKAYENNMDYSTFTVNMYGKYDGIHNFPFRENYRGYLDTIQARGHLKEFYEMVLNS